MYVAGIAAKYKHGAAIYHSRMMITRRWWCSSGTGTSPALVLDTEAYQIVQHALAIVAAKDKHGILVGHHSVLGASKCIFTEINKPIT